MNLEPIKKLISNFLNSETTKNQKIQYNFAKSGNFAEILAKFAIFSKKILKIKFLKLIIFKVFIKFQT